MGQTVIKDHRTVKSVGRPLLDDDTMYFSLGHEDSLIPAPDVANKNVHATPRDRTTGESEYKDGNDATTMEYTGFLAGTSTYCALGQWIWLYLVWRSMSDLFNGFNTLLHVVPSFAVWSLVMAGHLFFLIKLPISAVPPGCKESRLAPAAPVTQETLPVILSGLRVFCLGTGDKAHKFLLVIAVSFLVFELYSGYCGPSTASMPKRQSLDEMAVGHSYELHHQKSDNVRDIGHVEAQDEKPVLPEKESETDALNIENKAELDSRIIQKPDWVVVGQWIWLLLVWSAVPHLLEYYQRHFSHDEDIVWSSIYWFLLIFGHGIPLGAIAGNKSHERGESTLSYAANLFSVNRENLPMILSAFSLASINDTADQLIVSIAQFFILCQIVRAVWRFSIYLLTFAKTEKRVL